MFWGTGFYFKVPSLDHSLDVIRLNEDISEYKEITIMFYMKFLGSIEQRMGIVPIIYFYENKNYLGWDIEKQVFTINLLEDSSNILTIFSSNQSRLFVGKWSLFSISIYVSNYPLIFLFCFPYYTHPFALFFFLYPLKRLDGIIPKISGFIQ